MNRPDLSKYVDRRVFWAVLMIIAITSFWALAIDGIGQHVSISCPTNAHNGCVNQIAACHEMNAFQQNVNNCETILKLPCKGEICTREHLQPGETIGEKPKALPIAQGIIFFTIIAGMILSVVLYRRGK